MGKSGAACRLGQGGLCVRASDVAEPVSHSSPTSPIRGSLRMTQGQLGGSLLSWSSLRDGAEGTHDSHRFCEQRFGRRGAPGLPLRMRDV